MMEVLVDQYRDRRKLYLSWDGASWHISKRLFQRIEEHNAAVLDGGGPIVETAPLPTGAQFLNVIESVFSGMARSIVHNSDYKTLDDAKAAFDRYFEERNAHFRAASPASGQQDLAQGARAGGLLRGEQLQRSTLPLRRPSARCSRDHIEAVAKPRPCLDSSPERRFSRRR